MRIYPACAIGGNFTPPSDKSITLRAITFSTIFGGEVSHPLICGDTLAMLSCVESLGVKVNRLKDKIIIEKCDFSKVKNGLTLDAKNSGSTLRFILGLMCGANLTGTILGDNSLSSRSFLDIIEVLQKSGAKIESNFGKPPIKIIKGVDSDIYAETNSASVETGLIICGLVANKKVTIKKSEIVRNHTYNILSNCGDGITFKDNILSLTNNNFNYVGTDVCGDISAGVYYLSLGLLLGEATIKNVTLDKGRLGFIEIVKKLGGKIEIANTKNICGEFVGDITAKKSRLKGCDLKGIDISTYIDEAPLLFILSMFASGKTTFYNLKRLKNKETDRIKESVKLIQKLGGKAQIGGHLTIFNNPNIVGCDYKSLDHRMVMTATVALMASKNGGHVNEEVVSISNPDFFKPFSSFALFGGDIKNSLSPKIHKFLSGDNDMCFLCFNANKYNYQNIAKSYNLKGYFVTQPLKDTVYNFFKKNGKAVPITKTVNLVTNDECYNTDYLGFLSAISDKVGGLKGKNTLVYGNGGGAKAIITALKKIGANVFVVARDKVKAKKIAKDFGVKLYDGESYFALINCSVLGSREYVNISPFTESQIKNAKFIFDINYTDSKLLKLAKENNIENLSGLSMLFYQALFGRRIIESVGVDNSLKKYENCSDRDLYTKFLSSEVF